MGDRGEEGGEEGGGAGGGSGGEEKEEGLGGGKGAFALFLLGLTLPGASRGDTPREVPLADTALSSRCRRTPRRALVQSAESYSAFVLVFLLAAVRSAFASLARTPSYRRSDCKRWQEEVLASTFLRVFRCSSSDVLPLYPFLLLFFEPLGR